MQKIEVNCHRNSKHAVHFRSWKTFPQNILVVKVCLCLVVVAGLCTLNCHSQKQRNEFDYLHEHNLSSGLGTVSQLLHPMLGGNLSLGTVIPFLGKARGSGVSSRRLALLVLFVSIKSFCVTEASLCALVNMRITDSCSGIFCT